MKYLKRDVVKKTGISQRNIHFYIEEGLITPDFLPSSRGRGIPLAFSERNLLEFCMLEILREEFLPLSTIHTILHGLRKDTRVPKDFWENSEYGKTLELAFIQDRLHAPYTGPYTFRLIRENNQGRFEFDLGHSVKTGIAFGVVFLGKIRNMAFKKIGK